MTVMPMFPLGSVLLPGAVLPLHVFEPRYRQLVVDCLADDSRPPEFGVTLIERGREVGGGDDRAMVGVVARMVEVDALEGGRYSVVAVGTRRIRVLTWLPDEPYPIADVEDWPDDEAAAGDATDVTDRIAAATERLRAVLELAAQVGQIQPGTELPTISDDPAVAPYHLAALSPIGPADRYRLLCAPSVPARLDSLLESLDDVEAVLRFRLP